MLPEPLNTLHRVKSYDPKQFGSCVVFFVRKKAGESQLMYIGATENLPYYTVLMEKKAEQYGWSFTDVYYVPASVDFMDAVARALVAHYKPLMNSRRTYSGTDRRILRQLGLI